ncbi:tautomerase family protein [Kiloniella sp. b19]|uniref:tautomerase family protein n=1 Tax=Kiloniella sp. GXU_MW_B19 TaxID=3141326 RepID=UPI0031E1E683
MPIVTVQQSPRSADQKRKLVEGITQAFIEAYDADPNVVYVFFNEVDAEEGWAKNGKLAVDLKKG